MLILMAFVLALIVAVAIVSPFLRNADRSRLADEDTIGLELTSRWEMAIAGLRNTELEWAIGNLADLDRKWLKERYMTDAALVLKELELEEVEEQALMASVEREINKVRFQAAGGHVDDEK